MPSDDGRPGPHIVALVAELEGSVRDAEGLLIEREWERLDALLADQRRITHAISNAVTLSDGQRPDAFDRELGRRLRAIEERRADQMRRLRAFSEAVGSRLSVMARAKLMRKARSGDESPPPSLLDSFR